MLTQNRSVPQLVEEQVRKWQKSHANETPPGGADPVITISREPGSGGRLVAQGIAEKLGYDLFHQEVLHEMAESAHVSTTLLRTLDEHGVSVLDEWIASLVDLHHLWPDQYLRHLMRVIGTIGKHGRAVLVGRGANFVLPPERRLRVRVIAPRADRIRHVQKAFDISIQEAERRINQTESDRRAFIRKYFNADITDSYHYDLIINTGILTIETAVDAVAAAVSDYATQIKRVA